MHVYVIYISYEEPHLSVTMSKTAPKVETGNKEKYRIRCRNKKKRWWWGVIN